MKRVIAALIDSLIVTVAWLSLVSGIHQKFADESLVGLEYLVLVFLYYVFLESAFASTVGKHLLGLRVLGSSGDPVSLRESLVRNLLRLVDWLPLFYLLGVISIVISEKKQRLGDLATGTVVALAPEKDINPPPAPFLFH